MESSSQSITVTPSAVAPPKAPVRMDPSVVRRYRHLIVELEAELNAVEGRLKRWLDDQRALQAEIRKNKADKDAREARLQGKAQELKDAQAEIFRLNGEIDNLRKSIDEERKKRDEAESISAKQREELARARESLDTIEKLKDERKKANAAKIEWENQYHQKVQELEAAQKELKELKPKPAAPKDDTPPKPGPSSRSERETAIVAITVVLVLILLAAGFLIWQTWASARSSLKTAQANHKLLERIEAGNSRDAGREAGADTDTSATLADQSEQLDDISERLIQLQSSITPIEGDHPVLKQLEGISEDVKRNRELIVASKIGGSGNGNAAIQSRIDEILRKLNAIRNQLGNISMRQPDPGDTTPANGNEPVSRTGPPPSPSDEPALVKRTKIYPHSPVPVLSGQVLIKLLRISMDPGSRKMSASFHITLPNMKEVRLTNMSEGIRRAFEYQQRTYFFEVLSLSRAWAEIQVLERI